MNLLEPSGKTRDTFQALLSLAIILSVIIAAFTLVGCGNRMLGQSEATFREAFSQDAIARNGVASNDHVKESPYEVTAFEVNEMTEVDEVTVRAIITATIENANFTSHLDIEGIFRDSSENPSDIPAYTFSVLSSETAARKGIDFDEARGLIDVDSELCERGRFSTVVNTVDYDFWFVDTKITTTYTYMFNGTRWYLTDEEQSVSRTFKNIEGSYAARVNNDGSEIYYLTDFTNFSISEFDPSTGSFKIAYTIERPTRTFGVGVDTFPVVSGVLEATIDPRTTDEYEVEDDFQMNDGFSYYFEARGSSDSGEGNAVIWGYFSLNSAGDYIIEIAGGSIDVTYQNKNTMIPSLSQGAVSTSAPLEAGTLFKQ